MLHRKLLYLIYKNACLNFRGCGTEIPILSSDSYEISYAIHCSKLTCCIEGPCLSRGSNWKKTSLASLPRMRVLTIPGTPVPLTPRWYTLSVTTDKPVANVTRQMLTP